MKSKPTDFDPEHVFMNGFLNVTSAFCLNEFYDFGDPEQVKARYLTLRVHFLLLFSHEIPVDSLGMDRNYICKSN